MTNKPISAKDSLCPANQACGAAQTLPAADSAVDRTWKIGVTAVLFFLLFREELLSLLERWRDPQESHGLLIPAFSLYFIYQERHALRRLKSLPSYWGLAVIVLSLLWYVYWFFHGFSYPRQLAMIGVLLGVVLFLGGWQLIRHLWLPVVFLVFALPLPTRLHWEIAMPLRKMAAVVAAVILNGLPGVQVATEGVVIHGTHLVRGASESFSLDVAEACSGMRLLRTFVALGVAMAYLEQRHWSHRLVLLASTVPIAVFCNMLRVFLTGVFHIYLGREISSGTPHMLLGLAMLGVAFGLYGLLAWIMNRLFTEEDREAAGILVPGAKNHAS
ncbi:MAG: exosortase/archaeosortase family protein [Sedimentisphaerales bacterium]|nr:exosortase/archaeosortase family protein [Sedimentisphaerales bacterium]